MGQPFSELDILRACAQGQEVALDVEYGILFLEEVFDGFGLRLRAFRSHGWRRDRSRGRVRSRSRGGLRTGRGINGVLGGRWVRSGISIRTRVHGVIVRVVVVVSISPTAEALTTGFSAQAVSPSEARKQEKAET